MINHKQPSIANVGLTYGVFAAIAVRRVHIEPEALAGIVLTTLISISQAYASTTDFTPHYTAKLPPNRKKY